MGKSTRDVGKLTIGKTTAIKCECCGSEACEIKCPYKSWDDDITSALLRDNNFCLTNGNGHGMHLDKTYDYYYQIRCQIFVADIEYCDLVWIKKAIF